MVADDAVARLRIARVLEPTAQIVAAHADRARMLVERALERVVHEDRLDAIVREPVGEERPLPLDVERVGADAAELAVVALTTLAVVRDVRVAPRLVAVMAEDRTALGPAQVVHFDARRVG